MKVLELNTLKYFYNKIKASITSLTSRVSALESWKQSVLAGETSVMIFEKEE